MISHHSPAYVFHLCLCLKAINKLIKANLQVKARKTHMYVKYCNKTIENNGQILKTWEIALKH